MVIANDTLSIMDTDLRINAFLVSSTDRSSIIAYDPFAFIHTFVTGPPDLILALSLTKAEFSNSIS